MVEQRGPWKEWRTISHEGCTGRYGGLRENDLRLIYFVIKKFMKRSELFIACANNYDCKSDCDNCDLYLRYREEKED